LIFDAWSIRIIKNEWSYFYQNKDIKYAVISTKPIIDFERKYMFSERFKRDRDYWLEKFSGYLPTYFPVMEKTEQQLKMEFLFTIGGAVFNLYNDQCDKKGKNPLSVLLTAFYRSVAHFLNASDIIIGVPSIGRDESNVQMIGFFPRMILIRPRTINPDSPELMDEITNDVNESIEHSNFHYHHLIEALQEKNYIERFPLTGVFYNLVEIYPDIRRDDLEFTYTQRNELCRYDLLFYAYQYQNCLYFKVIGNGAKITRSIAKEFAEHYENEIQRVLAQVEPYSK
jgi:hypothetical protein